MGWTSPDIQQAIILGKVAGSTSADLATTYNVSKSTVDRILRQFKRNRPHASERLPGSDPRPVLEKLKQSLLVDSHVAIDRSVRDTGEVHKAASTGLAYLKGIGEHSSGERPADVNVNVLVANVPAGFDELMQRHNMADDDVTDAQVVDSTGESGSP